MNLYVTADDPTLCVEALDDLTLARNIGECARIMELAVTPLMEPLTPHPVSKWASQNMGSFDWAISYSILACEEWAKRFAVIPPELKAIEMTWKSRSMVEGHRQPFLESFEFYRSQLNDLWDTVEVAPVWTNRAPPKWARRGHRHKDGVYTYVQPKTLPGVDNV